VTLREGKDRQDIAWRDRQEDAATRVIVRAPSGSSKWNHVVAGSAPPDRIGVFCPAASHHWSPRRTRTYMAISEKGSPGSARRIDTKNRPAARSGSSCRTRCHSGCDSSPWARSEHHPTPSLPSPGGSAACPAVADPPTATGRWLAVDGLDSPPLGCRTIDVSGCPAR
jgi:hypothetical protein